MSNITQQLTNKTWHITTEVKILQHNSLVANSSVSVEFLKANKKNAPMFPSI